MTDAHDSILHIARAFLSEIFNDGMPLRDLINKGSFPEGWPDRYLEFIEQVSQAYGASEPLPREVIAVIYTASAYCIKRYHDWQRLTGGENELTKARVDEIRWAGDSLILSRYY